MAGKNRGGGRGNATFFDTLSPENAQKLAAMRKELERKVQQTIERQMRRPASPRPLPRPIAAQKENRPMPSIPGKRPKPHGYPKVKPKITVTSTSARSTEAVSRHNRNAVTNRPVPKPAEEFRYWDLPLEASVREEPPTTVSAQSRLTFNETIERGGASATVDGEANLFATIGLDFGTSSTKVIVRFPYEPGEPTIAIPSPVHCRSDGQSFLWKTVLWLRKDGEFIAFPEPASRVLHSLKQGVMGKKAESWISDAEYRGLKVTRADAAAAYLAFVIRYVRGWLMINRPGIFDQRTTQWFINLGLPAENTGVQHLTSVYRKVAAAALQTANHDGDIDIEVVKLFLKDKEVIAAAASDEQAEKLGISVVAETAAEAAGFSKSNQSAPDLYLMVDVGAMTLDVCAFRLHRNGADDQYALLKAMVRPLGVDAMHWFIGQGETEEKFRKQCFRSMKDVVWPTKTDKDPNARCWRPGNDLSVFLVGGGAVNKVHREVVEMLGPWLRKHAKNDGIRFLTLPEPPGIDCPEPMADFGRMAVAWGLSYPHIGIILPLSNAEDVPPPAEADWQENLASKDWV